MDSGRAGADGQTATGTPMRNRFTMSRTGEMGYYGAVFEIEQEIPD
jgi:hypothetical protein